MAKKKASAKKANVKKVVKKTNAKKVTKKVTKKAAPSKKTKPAKKVAKKVTLRKAKPVKKAAPKKVIPLKKPAAKKVAAAPQHLVKAVPAPKKVDLSGFVTPLDDRVIVQLSGTEKMTPGGLYIPDTVADTSGNLEGFIVAVGRGHQNKKGHVRPMDVRVGDRVVFSEYAGSKIKIQNEDLIILREGDILGVVSK